MLTTLKTWYQRRETMRQLSGLSDRALADIGILRADIGTVIRRAAVDANPVSKPRPLAARAGSQATVTPAFAGLAGKA